jgi:hypothetical protein
MSCQSASCCVQVKHTTPLLPDGALVQAKHTTRLLPDGATVQVKHTTLVLPDGATVQCTWQWPTGAATDLTVPCP